MKKYNLQLTEKELMFLRYVLTLDSNRVLLSDDLDSTTKDLLIGENQEMYDKLLNLEIQEEAKKQARMIADILLSEEAAGANVENVAVDNVRLTYKGNN